MADRFELEGEVFEFAEPDRVSLRMYVGLATDPAGSVMDLSYANFARLVGEFYALRGKPPRAFLEHPEGVQILAVVLWLGMVKKRQDGGDYSYLPFSTVLDANLATFRILPGDSGKDLPRKGRKKA